MSTNHMNTPEYKEQMEAIMRAEVEKVQAKYGSESLPLIGIMGVAGELMSATQTAALHMIQNGLVQEGAAMLMTFQLGLRTVIHAALELSGMEEDKALEFMGDVEKMRKGVHDAEVVQKEVADAMEAMRNGPTTLQ